MKVAITGAGGKVGQALIGQLDPEKFDVTQLDLPEHDSSNLEDLIQATPSLSRGRLSRTVITAYALALPINIL